MEHLSNSKTWMNYLENHFEDCVDYFKFAMVWMSFNSYYALRYKHIKGELNQIVEFSKDSRDIYLNFEDNEFKDVLQSFKDTGWLFDESGERDCVKDMRPGSNKKTYFKEGKKSCDDFFKVIHQIRCNLFHGNKEVSDPGNKRLVTWAYKYLNIFWKQFLDNKTPHSFVKITPVNNGVEEDTEIVRVPD